MTKFGSTFFCLAVLACAPLGCGTNGSSTGAPTGGSGGAATSGSAGAPGGPDSGGGLGGVAGNNTAGGSGGSVAPSDAGAAGADGANDGSSVGDTGGAPPDGGSSCSGLFCEDFEQGQVDPGKWSTPTQGQATMTIQQKVVAHGKYAVQFHGNAGQNNADYAYLITKSAPAALQTHNFGRAYFYITPKPNDIDMGMIYGGTAGFPRPTYLSIANHATGWQFGFIKLPGGETQVYAPSDIPVMIWTCLEWEFNDRPDEITVWGNGTLIGSLNAQSKIDFTTSPGKPLFNGVSTGLVGAFTDFGFGFYDWHPQGRPAFDLYYDDIVLDTKRVGCLPP